MGASRKQRKRVAELTGQELSLQIRGNDNNPQRTDGVEVVKDMFAQWRRRIRQAEDPTFRPDVLVVADDYNLLGLSHMRCALPVIKRSGRRR